MAETEQSIALRLEEMIEIQNRTKHTMELLIRQFADLSARLDGDRDDLAAAMIHHLLEQEFDLQVDELGRNWQKWDRTEEEFDVFGQAHCPTRPEHSLSIVGEVIFNLAMRDVERCALLLERAAKHLEGEIVPVSFIYRVRPAVREAVKDAGYRLLLSNGRMS